MKLKRALLTGALALIAIIMGGARFYTDFLWFVSVGFRDVFLKLLLSRVGLFAIVAALAGLFVYLNLRQLRNVLRQRLVGTAAGNVRYFPAGQPMLEFLDSLLQSRSLNAVMLAVSAGLGVMTGLSAAPGALSLLLFFNAEPTGIVDPLFAKDVSFYLLRLPVYTAALSGALALIILVLAGMAGVYFVSGNISFRRSSQTGAMTHLSILTGTALALRGVGYFFDVFKLMYSPRGAAFGASHTDMALVRPVLYILAGLCALGVALSLANIKRPRLRNLVAIPAALAIVSVVGSGIIPAIYQQIVVEPNELVRETPYLSNNIAFTRQAYGLGDMRVVDLPQPQVISGATVTANTPTLSNVRVLDWRPLLQTYSQLQSIRLYYRFHDVDIDRYQVNGSYQQVMIAAREMSINDLPAAGRTWLNEHLRYTHGYGVVMSPVTRVSPRGEPIFYLQDIPPRATHSSITVTRPELYFGEFPGNYVIINTKADEFSYPLGEDNATTRYEGVDGVTLNWFNRLMFSIRHGTTKIILSDDVEPNSRILFNRNILERTRLIAPFLTYESDPYIVISEGRLFWMLDAYTTSSNYPYSEPLNSGGLNYIRNSVKVVIDAYQGTVDYYIVDDSDPLILAYARTFPGMFKPYSEMPEGLKLHIRYPEQLLAVQASMLSIYHMTNPSTFYNREDVWRIAQEQYAGRQQSVDPYYMIMQPPMVGATSEEFMLVAPMTPAGTPANPRHNMVAYLAARNDHPNYGEIILYRFPKDTLIQGPMQVESRIDQDAEISASLTLWSQAGSTVFRGNLLVIPVGNSLIYVEPVYIQSTSNSLPELKKVIVATADKLAWGDTFEEALAKVVGIAPPTDPTPGDDEDDTYVEIVAALETAFRGAQEASQRGDWAEYGRLIGEVERLIGRLLEMVP